MKLKSLEGLPEACIWRTENLSVFLYNAVIFQPKEQRMCLKRLQGTWLYPD